MIPLLKSVRSSVRNNYPRWRIQTGFSKKTLITSNERVGSSLTLVLTMHISEVVSILECGHKRQKSKYYSHNVPCEENIDYDSTHSASDSDDDTVSPNDDNNNKSDEEIIVSTEN